MARREGCGVSVSFLKIHRLCPILGVQNFDYRYLFFFFFFWGGGGGWGWGWGVGSPLSCTILGGFYSKLSFSVFLKALLTTHFRILENL